MNNSGKKILFLIVYLLSAFFLSDLLLCLIAGGMYFFHWSEECMHLLILITYGASAGIAGYFAGKKEEKCKWLYGAAEGLAYFLIVMAISLIFGDGMQEIRGFITVLLITVLCGTLGSLIPNKAKK